MKRFLLLLLSSYFLLCKGANIKIINGEEVVPHSRPYMALLHFHKDNLPVICGGSLIKSDWVLTAAHCRPTVGNITVILGAHSRIQNETEKQVIGVTKLLEFKRYNSATKQNDIQLMKLSKNATLGTAVDILPLPETIKDSKEGTICRIAGWGISETGKLSDTLREISVTILDRGKCKKSWENNYSITTAMLCTNLGANGQDSCKGDSGGPLICDNVFRGVNSFGHSKCGAKGLPNVFTRLTEKYVSWIKETISSN
ncbi:granzyme A-like [Rana temporaria]|uniref:granzyme A-like n=1 Tax=Rana temporaria TaxID=8407 RepID=UPI001AACC39D|nr:granzyme A-like [Rana temporaria]